MNRLAAPMTHSASKLDFHGTHASSSLSAAAGREALWQRRSREASPGVALFAPVHYEARYAYPLIVWLHDDGSSERELRQLMPLISVRNYVGAATRGASAQDGSAGFVWPQTSSGIDEATDRVWECIELARKQYNVHDRRIFLAGHGAGGTMALRLALQLPLSIAGAISLNGPVPRGNCPLARINSARRLPFMLMTCDGSAKYPAAQVTEDWRLLHAAGFPLKLQHYLCGDELFTDMFSDMDQWLMDKVCASPAPAVV